MRPNLTKSQMISDVLNSADVYSDASFECDSPSCSLMAAGGRIAKVSKTLTNNGATHENLFTVTGIVRILQIYAVCTEATDTTTFSDVDFDVYDGATATVMTGANDLNGMAVKDAIAKTADDATALTFLDGSSAAYYENATRNKLFSEGIIVESSAGTTYIRLGYTGDATTDVDLTFIIRWQPMTSTSAITAV